jgi:hypothetical protein
MHVHNVLYRRLIIVVLVTLFVTAAYMPISLAATTGWHSPSANIADSGGDDNGFETDPSNAYGDDGDPAENHENGDVGDLTDRHIYYNYSFNISPGSTIQGIEVQLDWWLDKAKNENSMSVDLSWDGGTSWTDTMTDTTQTKKEHTFILGGPSDTWGRTWSASDFSNDKFRVRVNCYSDTEDSRDFFLDWVAVRVTYETSAPPPSHSIYLPLVMKDFYGYGPDSYEPNNSCEQAHGSLNPSQIYQSWISDYDLATYKKSDYFYVDIITANTINIYLTDIPAGTDYDLYLYRNPIDDPNNPAAVSNEYGNEPETILYNPPATGRYYIRVHSYSGYSASPYSLRVTYD